MITASFRVPARRAIGPSHRRRRILALKVLGFGAWSIDQFVLEEKNDALRVLGWMTLRVLGLRPNLR